MVRRALTLVLTTALVMGAVISCRAKPAKLRAELVSSSPVKQVSAAVEVAEIGDLQSIPNLIALLDSTDPAVRMYAIMALQDLTGQTCGYKFYASETERAAAIRRWQAALRAGKLPVCSEMG